MSVEIILAIYEAAASGAAVICISNDECCIQNDECCIQNDLDLLPDRQRGWELPDGTRVG